MEIVIRPYVESDYSAVASLIQKAGYLEIPLHEEIKKVSLVAEYEGSVCAFVWALTDGTSAYIDYFCLDRDRKYSETIGNHTSITFLMMKKLMIIFDAIGVKKVIGSLADTSSGDKLSKTYSLIGMRVYPSKFTVFGSPDLIIKGMEGIQNGWLNQDTKNNIRT